MEKYWSCVGSKRSAKQIKTILVPKSIPAEPSRALCIFMMELQADRFSLKKKQLHFHSQINLYMAISFWSCDWH